MLSHEIRGLAGWLLNERPEGDLPEAFCVTLGDILKELAEGVEELERLKPPPASEMEARAAAAESGKLVEIVAMRRAL